MKKKVLSIMLCAALGATMLAGCGSSDEEEAEEAAVEEEEVAEEEAEEEEVAEEEEAEEVESTGKVLAFVSKSAGNPYNEKEAEGFTEAAEEAGYEVIIQHPESATAEAQITVINSLISQGVDSITVAANDENALQSVLQDAMDAGIQVSCMDSKTNADSRATFVNQAGTQEIGETLMEAVYDISGGSGQWAILSATSQATNQNAWIDAMQEIWENDEKYADLEMVEVAYGDDESQKSTDQTQALLQKYPDLKVICSPTTVGINAAAKVLQDEGSDVKLTGLGLPSEMAEYIGDDDEHSCPYMYLWNPVDLGRLSAFTAIALVEGDITGAEGESFSTPDGDYTIQDAGDGGTEIILGPPFEFNPDNIDDWKDVY